MERWAQEGDGCWVGSQPHLPRPSRLPPHGGWGSGRVTAQLGNVFFLTHQIPSVVQAQAEVTQGKEKMRAEGESPLGHNGNAKLQFSQGVVSDPEGS